jgi:hypothetical protein
VTNYELPEVRRKIEAEAKDKSDFLNYRKALQPNLNGSILDRPDSIQLVQHIVQYMQKYWLSRPMGGNFDPNNQNLRNAPIGALVQNIITSYQNDMK